MALNPIEFNGMIQRTSDYSILKQQDDTKAAVNQQNIQSGLAKTEDNMANRVNEAEDSNFMRQKYDAKEEGKNKYYRQNKGKNERELSRKQDGKVIRKDIAPGFDITV